MVQHPSIMQMFSSSGKLKVNASALIHLHLNRDWNPASHKEKWVM